MIPFVKWLPAALFAVGSVLVHGLGPQETMGLRQELATAVPASFPGYANGVDVEVSEAEANVAGFSNYVMRTYDKPDGDALSVYVAYYASQTQGQTIHSPKNCLPGSGWEPVESRVANVSGEGGVTHEVNRYILQREDQRALVLYWYQGRGRVAHNEYRVKWDLLRDAALRRRSDEALVRIVVPVTSTEEAAFERASAAAAQVIPAVDRALPE